MDLNLVWQEFGLDKLEEGMGTLFPQTKLSLEKLLGQVMEGDVFGALSGLFTDSISDFWGQLTGMRNVLVFLLVLGLVSSLMTHFVEIFDMHQVADMGFYFMYLLFTAVLLQCFSQVVSTAQDTLAHVSLFIKLMVPAYLLSVGISTGIATVNASCQLMMIVIYGVETLLAAGMIPLIYSICMLAVVNGIWAEEKLTLIIELLEKCVGWVLKGAIGVVTGLSIFQALITPVVDSVKTSALQRFLSAIPGVGNAADGVVDLVIGSASVIKNSIGVVLLILFLLMCAAPLLKIALIAGVLKCAAAFMGIVSDSRITSCANRAGNAALLMLRTTATAMLLFLISIAVITVSGRSM